jgi:hypothetical protein
MYRSGHLRSGFKAGVYVHYAEPPFGFDVSGPQEPRFDQDRAILAGVDSSISRIDEEGAAVLALLLAERAHDWIVNVMLLT